MSKLTDGLKAITAHAKERREALVEAMEMASLEAQLVEARLREDGLLDPDEEYFDPELHLDGDNWDELERYLAD